MKADRNHNGRYELLDILRGTALLGICIANFGELSLYTFQPASVTSEMPSASVDSVVKFLQYLFIDGKFYTLFSLLFGIGFSIILSNCERNGRDGVRVFYRQMFILLIIGMAHMILLWAGDILVLYAALGMLLPLLRKLPDRKLLWLSIVLLLLPVLSESFTALTGDRYSLMISVNQAVDYLHSGAGITPGNFGTWLVDSGSYVDIVRFNIAGFFIRIGEFIEGGDRAFKVLGLFLTRLYIGRKKLFVYNRDNESLVRKIMNWSFAVGLPLSIVYSWNAVSHYPLSLSASAALYSFSVYPMGITYASSIYLFYYGTRDRLWKYVAAPGRMALTNYIGQSVIGIIIYYGVGFSLGARMGLIWVDLTAIAVFVFQMLFSCLWLRYFNYGPLEWIWRMLTYGKRLGIRKT